MAAISLHKIECPYCNGIVSVDADMKTCFCTYCGRQIAIDDGKQVIRIEKEETHRYIDVAKMRRIELEEERRRKSEEEKQRFLDEQKAMEEAKELERRRKRNIWKLSLIAYIVIGVLISFPYIRGHSSDLISFPMFTMFGSFVLVILHYRATEHVNGIGKTVLLWFTFCIGSCIGLAILASIISSVFHD